MKKIFLSLLTLSLIGCAHTKEENKKSEEPVIKYECYDQVPSNTPIESNVKEDSEEVKPTEPLKPNFPKRLYNDKN